MEVVPKYWVNLHVTHKGAPKPIQGTEMICPRGLHRQDGKALFPWCYLKQIFSAIHLLQNESVKETTKINVRFGTELNKERLNEGQGERTGEGVSINVFILLSAQSEGRWEHGGGHGGAGMALGRLGSAVLLYLWFKIGKQQASAAGVRNLIKF